MARHNQRGGLKISIVIRDTDQPPNNACTPFAPNNVTLWLSIAEIFGTMLIRCRIKRPEHLGWLQRACD